MRRMRNISGTGRTQRFYGVIDVAGVFDVADVRRR
jgi:hypothetical protein